MSVISLSQQGRYLNAPLTLFIDLQMEYVAAERAFYMSELDDCLANCKMILNAIRKKKMPVAHFRRIIPSPFFNKQTEFSQWIDEFRPRPNEMVFERSQPSCYSSSAFAQFVKNISTPEIFIVGIPGEESCLATAIEASHIGHLTTYVCDASASHSIGLWDESESHQAITKIIGIYANICTTEEFIYNISGNKNNNAKYSTI